LESDVNAFWGERFRRGKRTGGALTAGGSNRLLTPEEVAAWLKVSEITVKNKYRTWGLKAQKVGRLLRFRERDIIAYLEDNYG
jgi:excisionase family DNA binding protein